MSIYVFVLELSMRFNPELTGRQNVCNVTGLMGFTPEHINEAMHGIEAFA